MNDEVQVNKRKVDEVRKRMVSKLTVLEYQIQELEKSRLELETILKNLDRGDF